MDTYDRIVLLMNENNERPTDISKATGISTGLLSQWKSRMQKPSNAKLALIAEHYGVTVDYLLTGEQKEKPTAKSDEVTFDDFTYALHNQSKELNDANKEKLLDMARMLKLAQEAQKNK